MDSLKGSLAAMNEMFHAKMNEFQRELHKNTSMSSSALPSEFSAFRSFILTALETLQKQVEFLGRELDRQEMRGRRKMLLFHGVPERKAENTSTALSNIISEKLNVPEFSAESIKRSSRLGHSSSDKKPRPIVVKFHDKSIRDKVWFAKTKLKGSGVTQSEFLTRTRHDLFLEARRRFGVSSCWTKEGCVLVVGRDRTLHKIECLADLDSCAPTATSSVQSAAADNAGASTDTDNPLHGPRTRRMLKK